MIDVNITPIGRTLVSMTLGVMKYQAVVNQKNADLVKRERENIKQLQQERDMFSEMSFDITTRMIDKRFTTSKEFMKTREVGGGLTFKKSLTNADKDLEYISRQVSIRANTKHSVAVSQQNKRLVDLKTNAKFKLINLKGVL